MISNTSDQMAQSSKTFCYTQEELNKQKSDNETLRVAKATLLQKKINDLDSTELNIAVTGESGSGKSTFINAMRGLRSDDEGAAETGNIETTMEPIGYKDLKMSNVRFWDLPGIGTTRFPADKYLREMNFETYNFFIIISHCRFRENDAELAKEIRRLGKKFYFVRSKIDNDIKSVRNHCTIFNEKEELAKIKNDCVKNLQQAGIPSPSVFLISNFDQCLYDFNLLKHYIIMDNLSHGSVSPFN
ncbi:T-cell-specific guanine nucleotide triphosphate-binding protein 2-like isoform X2 [Rhincodon typus]|uniref:T-cell-specific guanine nucleotide triphosphate-binding protein 2-like isoform X2 n=1 Tax=Rhincodon typus TaxID=259920 RepID=UPI002030962D|nr:T-cell-specific guanine nucleotide triphosphate-binding protein 2-like isoform X2 [Rhincodon typus]